MPPDGGKIGLFLVKPAAFALLLVATDAHAAPARATGRATDPEPRPTLPWLAFQLVPSPEIAFGERGAHFGLLWQVTPVLYAFRMHRRLSPWRFFVAEPVVRHAGSIELFLSPEYLSIEPELRDRFSWRAGVRSYFGLLHRGEYLAVSVGTSYFGAAGQDAVLYEGGAYMLFGVLGLQLGYAPAHDTARFVTTLRFRFF